MSLFNVPAYITLKSLCGQRKQLLNVSWVVLRVDPAQEWMASHCKFATILIFQMGDPHLLPVQDFKWVRILIQDVSVPLFLKAGRLEPTHTNES